MQITCHLTWMRFHRPKLLQTKRNFENQESHLTSCKTLCCSSSRSSNELARGVVVELSLRRRCSSRTVMRFSNSSTLIVFWLIHVSWMVRACFILSMSRKNCSKRVFSSNFFIFFALSFHILHNSNGSFRVFYRHHIKAFKWIEKLNPKIINLSFLDKAT